MGRPNVEKKREKSRRQKQQCSNRILEVDACAYDSPPLFSDTSTGENGDVDDTPNENDTSSTALGDADTDLIEMEIYDMYREDDGQPYSLEYLQKCVTKLQRKVKDDKVMINNLQRMNMKLKSQKRMKKNTVLL